MANEMQMDGSEEGAEAASVPVPNGAGGSCLAVGTAATDPVPTGSTAASSTPAGATPASPTPDDPALAAPVRLAVFDYDGTIVDGQSGVLFSRYLLQKGLVSVRTASRLVWWGARYKLHLPYRQDEARELIFRDFGHLGPERARAIMRKFHDEVLVPRYRKDAIAELRRVSEEGCVTLLVSATFQEIAKVAATDLGMGGVAATRMQVDDQGNFTGAVEGEVVAGPGKCSAVRTWADEHIGPGKWRIAYAYGDHFTDEPLLELADHSFAVCPGKTMRQVARRHGWPVLDWN